MKPSKAAMTSSRFSIACGFSILAMIGSITPSSRMICADVLGVLGVAHEATAR